MDTFAYEPYREGRLRPGAARAELASEVARLGLQRLLLVVGTPERALAEELVAPLAGRIAGTFTGVAPHVPVEVAAAARRAPAKVGVQGLLAIGGGSTTGAAKAVALETCLPIVAIPTTYAGSEWQRSTA